MGELSILKMSLLLCVLSATGKLRSLAQTARPLSAGSQSVSARDPKLGSRAHAVYAAPPTKECSLLTQAQVGAALGMKVGAGRALMAKVRIWPGAQGKRVTLNLINSQAFAAAKMPIGNGIIKTEASGIDDDVSSQGAPTTLTVKKGDAAFTLTVFGFSDDQAKEKTLALDVLAKL